MSRDIHHFLNGKSFEGQSGQYGDVYNPSTGEVQTRVQFATVDEVNAAVAGAKAGQQAWAAMNPQRRARILMKYKMLVEAEMDSLAEMLSSEHGKVIADAKGDIIRGLEVVEFAMGVPHLMKGEYTESAGPGIDVFSMRQPLGVVAGISPFNFPAMIPMWFMGMALSTGNALVLKPSEKGPSVPVRLAELWMEAGLPEGVLQVVHGDKTAVDALLHHDDIKAVSFVGSSNIAQYIAATCANNGKRFQAMGGAKNHGIIMPDADMDQVVKDFLGAAYGSAGERCMALPVAVPVGQDTADEFVARMKEEAQKLQVGVSTDPDAHYGPVVSSAHRASIEKWIQTGVDEGADLLLDGRGFALQGHEKGFFIGPSLFDKVTPEMTSYQEEIFGPVLQVVRANDLEEAASLPSQHKYGNGVAIFTRNGLAAREFAAKVNVGMVGINVPIPVPVAYHSFGGWKRSAFTDTNQYGTDGIRFFTKVKTVTQRWPSGEIGDQAFVIPTMR
ncbi:CoA-acylating methylmalonate-semialdehyde dehydrogenase [Maricaulis sp.]|uniref:CoA-acylating methylmalonate-semialdehyde dehydrogenase n=1 Tax=Maricaulis sp. TaxID=1486257 RepID=UPI00262F69BA|nr:CoA-acylating methylmalonate-semialdehyde dehydrogenase [Maricaulis sp.]